MWLLAVLLPLVRLYLCGIKVLLYQMFNRSFTLPVLPKQNGRVAIVTGGTRGMGFETARHLASLGMHVVIAGNEREEGTAAVRMIHEEGSKGKDGFNLLLGAVRLPADILSLTPQQDAPSVARAAS